MRIGRIDAVELVIPFEDGGRDRGMMPSRWDRFDMVLVRVEDEDGTVGWGEAFGYFCRKAVRSLIDELIAPMVVGQEISDIAAFNLALQRRLCLFGRHGVTIFALSGIDIALWDLKARREGAPLAELLGGIQRSELPVYASLVRYGDAEIAAAKASEAVREGYREIKLHEIALPEIEACRKAMGPEPALMVDVNNGWTVEETRELLPALKALDTLWLEEPIFPPEDHASLALLARQGVAMAAGENLCTRWPFQAMLEAGAVGFAQPSVTKVGGISEFLAVAALARQHGVRLMPHSPYFGPGYLATMQLLAAGDGDGLLERLYVEPAASLSAGMPRVEGARIRLPEGPGLGLVPDEAVIARYRVA